MQIFSRDRMTALQSLKHPWLYDDKQKLAHPISPTRSPFGSPLGCRRALTPSPGETHDTEEPLRKCKCDADRRGSVSTQLQLREDTEVGSGGIYVMIDSFSLVS